MRERAHGWTESPATKLDAPSPASCRYRWFRLRRGLDHKALKLLMVFVFDERESRRAEEIRPALDQLGEKALLWLALRDPTEEEVAAVQEVFEFSDEQPPAHPAEPSASTTQTTRVNA